MARRTLIVGNGAAGLAAAEAIRGSDPSAAITLLSLEPYGFYSRPGLAYLLAGLIPERALFSRPDEDYRALGLQRLRARAVHIDAGGHRLQLQDGRWLPYDALLLATGARAVLPPIPGIELYGVVTLDTLDDARLILKLARRCRRAVVVGGGITALELAEGLVAHGVETHYLLRKDRYWAGVLDPDESQLVESRLESGGVRIRRQSEIARVLGKRGEVVGVELTSGEKLACGMLGVAIGIAPRLELARTAGVAIERGILTDEYMATSVPDIYAAGDVAQAFDRASGRHVLDSLWWVAIEQGRAAGENMAGARRPYEKGIPFNVTRIGGLTTTLIGAIGTQREEGDLVSIARGDSEMWRQRPDAFAVEADAEQNRLRVLIDQHNVVGALVMGDQTASLALQQLIAGRVDITPIRNRLTASSAGLSDVIHGFWQDWRDHQRPAR
jgi:NAD(P)H-nitrite reductase large subunit